MTDLTLQQLPFIDLYIRLDAPEAPTFRSQDRQQAALNQLVPEGLCPAVERFGTAIRAELQDRKEGTITFEGVRCRVTEMKMADESLWVCARRINSDLPELSSLGFAPHIYNQLHTLGQRSGLILVSGPSGHGKTTTAIGLLTDYLKSYGGTAITLEHPVEYVVKGRHGSFGQCFQRDVGENANWGDAIQEAMGWAPRYIFIGDITNPDAAEQILHAASTGHTVIAAAHGGQPEEALISLLHLARKKMGEGATSILAGCLTALIHQTMREDGPFIRYVYTSENVTSDPIRSLIREGKIAMLSTYIDRLSARLSSQATAPSSFNAPPNLMPEGTQEPMADEPPFPDYDE